MEIGLTKLDKKCDHHYDESQGNLHRCNDHISTRWLGAAWKPYGGGKGTMSLARSYYWRFRSWPWYLHDMGIVGTRVYAIRIFIQVRAPSWKVTTLLLLAEASVTLIHQNHTSIIIGMAYLIVVDLATWAPTRSQRRGSLPPWSTRRD
mgnify:CR=1 FL=1